MSSYACGTCRGERPTSDSKRDAQGIYGNKPEAGRYYNTPESHYRRTYDLNAVKEQGRYGHTELNHEAGKYYRTSESDYRQTYDMNASNDHGRCGNTELNNSADRYHYPHIQPHINNGRAYGQNELNGQELYGSHYRPPEAHINNGRAYDRNELNGQEIYGNRQFKSEVLESQYRPPEAHRNYGSAYGQNGRSSSGIKKKRTRPISIDRTGQGTQHTDNNRTPEEI